MGAVLGEAMHSVGAGRVIGRACRRAALALTMVLVLLRIPDAVRFVTTGVAAIRYRFGLDFGEGVVFDQTRRLLSGQMYEPLHTGPPYVISNYPPVFHVLAGLASFVTHDPLVAGRALSLLSTLAAAVIIARLVSSAMLPLVGVNVRRFAALLGALGFLTASYTATWAALMRVDMLALVLALAGVLAFVTHAPRGKPIFPSVALFLLAFYTKPTMVAAPAACFLVALLADRSLAWRFCAALLAGVILTFVLLEWFTGGQFYFQVVLANVNAYDWRRTLVFLDDLKRRYPVELAIAVVAVPSLLRGARPSPAARPAEPEATPATWARPVLAVYLCTAFLVSLTVGKVGSEVNYLIEFIAVVWTCVAVEIADGFADASPTLAAGMAALLAPALLMAPAVGLLRRPAIEWVEVPGLQESAQVSQLVDVIHNTIGPVLSEDLVLLERAGKPVEFQPCDMAHLADQGEWNQSGFLSRLRQERYRLVVLEFSLAGRVPHLDRFTPQMLAALRDHYVTAGRMGGYWLYRPRGVPG